jgi:hypothetical protein
MLIAVLQIKLSYSVHRDLNVKANNERGWDWTGSNLLQTPATPAMHNGYGSGPATPVNPLACTPEDAPTGRYLSADPFLSGDVMSRHHARMLLDGQFPACWVLSLEGQIPGSGGY